MNSQLFVIVGEPVAQARVRFSKKSGRVYEPSKSGNYKTYIQQEIQKQSPFKIEQGIPIRMTLWIGVSIPKSMTKKERVLIEEGKLLRTKKPDVSNYVKGIEDACNGILYHDDAQIVELIAKKEYSKKPRIEIKIEIL